MPPPRRHFWFYISLVCLFSRLFALSLLVGNTAAGLASRLAGGLALAASALFSALAKILGFKCIDMFHYLVLHKDNNSFVFIIPRTEQNVNTYFQQNRGGSIASKASSCRMNAKTTWTEHIIEYEEMPDEAAAVARDESISDTEIFKYKNKRLTNNTIYDIIYYIEHRFNIETISI